MGSGSTAPLILHHGNRRRWAISLTPPAALLLAKTSPGKPLDRGWVGPRDGLIIPKKRKNFCPYEKSNINFSFIQAVTSSLD
jgi:hypothetical protein